MALAAESSRSLCVICLWQLDVLLANFEPFNTFLIMAHFMRLFCDEGARIILQAWHGKPQISHHHSVGKFFLGPGYGVKSSKDVQTMESAQPLSDHPLAIDAVLFSGGGPDGTYLVAAQARRKLGMNNTIFSLRIPEIGVLLHPKHPDTTLFTTSMCTYKRLIIIRCIFHFS